MAAWFDKQVIGTASAFAAGWGDSGVGSESTVPPSLSLSCTVADDVPHILSHLLRHACDLQLARPKPRPRRARRLEAQLCRSLRPPSRLRGRRAPPQR